MLQLRWMWKNLFGKRRMLITGLILSVVTCSAAIVVPKLTQFLIDDVLHGGNDELLIPILTLMVVVPLVRFALRYLMIMFLEKSTQHLYYNVKMFLFDSIINQDQRFFNRYRTGDLITRITGDLGYVRHAGAWISYQVIDAVTFVVASSIFLSTINFKLTLSILAITPFLFLLSFLYVRRVKPYYFALRNRLSQLNTATQENISGNRVVKAFAREDFEINKFEEVNNDYMEMNITIQKKWMSFWPIIAFFAQSLTGVTLLFGGLFIMNGELTLGEFSAFSGMLWAFSTPIQNLGVILNDLQRVISATDKVMEIYYSSPTVVTRLNCVNNDNRIKGDISFENVSFKFDNNVVLDNISFDIKSGETIAVMGPTGSGKTTMINLICRFYDVSGGKIKIDNIDVRDYSLEKLRSSIGVATQDVFLYSDTVTQNISFCDINMPFEQVAKSAKVSDADGFISDMEQGYETIIGERGTGLSGGQRQRIALARAIAARPSILILDDTTSAVDSKTEKYIQKQLSNLDFYCTKIIVAQRISSVKHADRIFIFEDGKLTIGTHNTLKSVPGYYREVCELQNEPHLPELVKEML